jgi:hypothetical protein
MCFKLRRMFLIWKYKMIFVIFFFWSSSPTWARAASFLRFLDHRKWHTTVGRTPLDDTRLSQKREIHIRWDSFLFCLLYLYFFVLIILALPFVLYCKIHITQTSMPPAGFEPATPVSDRWQTLAINRSATGIGILINSYYCIRLLTVHFVTNISLNRNQKPLILSVVEHLTLSVIWYSKQILQDQRKLTYLIGQGRCKSPVFVMITT